MIKDFTGFRFGCIHSSDLHLVVVSSSDRYTKNVLPKNNDYTEDVPGGNGQYYFGQTYSTREFTIEVAFDKVDEKTWRKISQLFSTDKLQDLVFDELPYKTYRAKLSQDPEFKFICFSDHDTGERVYKGEGTLNFICYFPFAYGFNKYIIRAADDYLLKVPEPEPRVHSIEDNPYKQKITKIYNKDLKEQYNVKNNMNAPWKGGYPTIEQVRAGELYFDAPDGQKQLIDVRDYFRNVPEWAKSSGLLTTPTLDFDQELIFLPQYSKLNYINMDTGMNSENAVIGSRILVYNPGDLPVDFELRMNNEERTFWLSRGNHFKVRRFNVQRLTIPQAVDWTGLKTLKVEDEEEFKYGRRYFEKLQISKTNGDFSFDYALLGDKHPKHCYIAEPIQRERLGHFIRLWYWQSSKVDDDATNPINFEDGVRYADRYEELYKLCINDDERFELYWKTLKEAILDQYKKLKVFSNENEYATIENFIYNYIHCPPEFIRQNDELYYGQFDFNIGKMPQWITEDYFDITTDGIKKPQLFLDTEKEQLYNINNPEYNKNDTETYSNFYTYKPTKDILNDNIEQGHWFKIPTGWSLIEVIPVCDEDNWGGKRWLDARPFDWGYGGSNGTYAHGQDGKLHKQGIQENFDKVFEWCQEQYLKQNGKYDEDKEKRNQNTVFRSWYSKFKPKKEEDPFGWEFYQTLEINAEYGFLKLLHSCWQQMKGIITDWDINKKQDGVIHSYLIKGKISEWWWYACNYLWGTFPPLYWAYADILNDAIIKYVPLFY